MTNRDLTTEELLHIVATSQDDVSPHLSQVNKFILDYKLKRGRHKITTDVIYAEYKRWCEKYSQDVDTKIIFFKSFSKYFKQERSGRQRYYLLNEDPFKASEEHIMEVAINGQEKQ